MEAEGLAEAAPDAITPDGIAHLACDGDAEACPIVVPRAQDDQEGASVDAQPAPLRMPIICAAAQTIVAEEGMLFRAPDGAHSRSLLRVYDRDAATALAPACVQDVLAAFSFHARAESVRTKSASPMGLISPLHDEVSREKLAETKARRSPAVKRGLSDRGNRLDEGMCSEVPGVQRERRLSISGKIDRDGRSAKHKTQKTEALRTRASHLQARRCAVLTRFRRPLR